MRIVVLGGLGALLFHGLCAVMLCGASLEKLALRRWVETPCVIEETRLVPVSGRPAAGKARGHPSTYRLDVVYRYEREGRNWTGDRWRLYDPGFGDREELIRKAASLPKGHRPTCHVHPTDPSRSLLYRDRVTEVDVVLLALCLGVVPVLILSWMGVSITRLGRSVAPDVGAPNLRGADQRQARPDNPNLPA